MNAIEVRFLMSTIPVPSKGIKEKTILREYPELHTALSELTAHIPGPLRFIQKWHLVRTAMLTPTECAECGVLCGLAKQGYFTKYCSDVCRQVDTKKRAQIAGIKASEALKQPGALEKRIKKSIETNMARYGVSNPMQNENIKNKLKAVNLNKHGSKYPLSLKSVQDKIEMTNLKRYNVRRPLQRKDVNKTAQISSKATWEKNWSTGHPFSDTVFRDKVKDILIAKYGVSNIGMLQNFRSKGEVEMFEFILSVFPDAIPTYRKIEGVELDVFVPSINTGFEYNGIYFHCDAFPNARNRHSDKRNHFLDNGIRVIQVWEDQWKQNKKVMKSFISNLSGNNKVDIGARQCTVSVNVSAEEANTLLNELHVQGSRGHATLRIGLYFDNELVSLMLFTKTASNVRLYGNDSYELTRFVNKGVRGAFTKLLSRFQKINSESMIYSFADLEIVDERKNVYTSNGFNEHHRIPPDYKYVVNGARKHKFGFRQEELEGKNIPKVYDCGKICYVLK